jgi:hypothetical protein
MSPSSKPSSGSRKTPSQGGSTKTPGQSNSGSSQ